MTTSEIIVLATNFFSLVSMVLAWSLARLFWRRSASSISRTLMAFFTINAVLFTFLVIMDLLLDAYTDPEHIEWKALIARGGSMIALIVIWYGFFVRKL